MTEIRILSARNDIKQYIADVRLASDSNKQSLGFVQSSVFAEYAYREKLLVAVDVLSNQYIGHLLFDAKLPRASILQMYCEESHRRKGVATQLLKELKDTLTQHNFLSIKARVAEDLKDSNIFWEKQGFPVISRVLGGVTTGRKILVRVHELESPQLFPKSRLSNSGSNNLGLAVISSAALPMYLVDLNVLFDLAHQRVRHDYAVNLFRSFYAGECRLAISDEIRNELQRTSRSGDHDPMLALIDALPEVRLVHGKDNALLCDQLAPIVFPEKTKKSQFSENDKSDLMHLATVIHGKLAGLITSDGRILEAAPIIQSKFDIQISSPIDFDISVWQGIGNSEIETGIQSRLDFRSFQAKDYVSVKDLLMRSGLSIPDIVGGWLPTDTKGSSSARMIVRQNELIIGYVSWSRAEPASKEIKVRAVLDEEYSHGASVIQMLLRNSLDGCDVSGMVKLNLYLPERQVSIKEIAYKMGFRVTETSNRMAKVAVNVVVTPESWHGFVKDLQIAAHIKLPKLAPKFESFSQLVEVGCPDGDRRYVRLDELENLLSPVLFCLTGRQAIVVPIKPKYASALLGHTKQLSLAPKMQVEASDDRLYFNSPNSLKHYQRGNIILFYESGRKGAQAIVAAARVVDSYLIRCDETDEQSLRRSVLRSDMMREIGRSANKAACLFDNIVVFQKPVPLKLLNNIGYKNNSLLTTNKLSQEQLSRVLEEGLRRD